MWISNHDKLNIKGNSIYHVNCRCCVLWKDYLTCSVSEQYFYFPLSSCSHPHRGTHSHVVVAQYTQSLICRTLSSCARAARHRSRPKVELNWRTDRNLFRIVMRNSVQLRFIENLWYYIRVSNGMTSWEHKWHPSEMMTYHSYHITRQWSPLYY